MRLIAKGKLTTCRRMEAGVPQGAVLLVFSFYCGHYQNITLYTDGELDKKMDNRI